MGRSRIDENTRGKNAFFDSRPPQDALIAYLVENEVHGIFRPESVQGFRGKSLGCGTVRSGKTKWTELTDALEAATNATYLNRQKNPNRRTTYMYQITAEGFTYYREKILPAREVFLDKYGDSVMASATSTALDAKQQLAMKLGIEILDDPELLALLTFSPKAERIFAKLGIPKDGVMR